MSMLIFAIILVAIVIGGISQHILLSRRLSQLEHQIKSNEKQLGQIVANVGNLSLLTRRHDKEIVALRETNSTTSEQGSGGERKSGRPAIPRVA
jgi:hypothetical protein